MYLDTSTIRPEILPKGWYWLDTSTGGFAWRAKYNGDEFVSWENTGFTTQYILENPQPSPPYPVEYQVPPSGFFEMADLKLEWNSNCTIWTRYPGEVYGKNYRMDEKGFTIQSGKNQMFIDEDEIIAKYENQEVFKITENETHMKKIKTFEINIGDFTLKETEIKNKNMLVLY